MRQPFLFFLFHGTSGSENMIPSWKVYINPGLVLYLTHRFSGADQTHSRSV